MSEPISVSPLLDGFTLGSPVNDHFGVCSYPAVKENSDRKYIVKVISVPASQTQLEALLITGAYQDSAGCADYFLGLSKDLLEEIDFLKSLSQEGGFVPYEGCQMEPMRRNRVGFEIYLISRFRLTLDRYMHRHSVSHLEAVNLGIDMCTALDACRKAGRLYIDLKPANIFISHKKEYKIGDLGFVPMDSIRYMAMPAKYRSPYTAPELLDDLSVLNNTADTYALGLILYQIFNNGALPQDLTVPLPAPVNADEELAAILAKACAVNPADRWDDPALMRQALVNYMQAGVVNDEPIMNPLGSGKPIYRKAVCAEASETAGEGVSTDVSPEADSPAAPEPTEEEDSQDTSVPEEEVPSEEPVEETHDEASADTELQPDDSEPVSEDASEPPEDLPAEDTVTPPEEEPPVDTPPAEDAPSDTAPEALPDADISGNDLIFLEPESMPESGYDPVPLPELRFGEESDFFQPESLPQTSPDLDGFTIDDLADAVSQDFSAETELDSDLKTPPQPPKKAPARKPSRASEEDHLDRELQELNRLLNDDHTARAEAVKKQHPNVAPVIIEPEKKKKSPLQILFIVFLIMLLLSGSVWGYMYYISEYLQPISGISISEQGGTVTITVDSEARQGLLSVVCTDPYGNAFTQHVRDGKAVFTQLTPGTFYTAQVTVSGMHKLSQPISEVFTTESTTNVMAFNAAVGATDASIALNLIVEGHEPSQWRVLYIAEGEPELSKTFTGHTVTVDNLTIGKQYDFRLQTGTSAGFEDAKGINTVSFTASRLITAKNATVISCNSGELVVSWENATDFPPECWRVRCAGGDYDETLETTDLTATFSGIDSAKSYTIEISAKGMTQISRVSVSANPITLTTLDIDDSNPQELALSWQFEGTAPEGGWLVTYTLDGSSLPNAVRANGNTAVVAPRIPGAVYHFSFETSGDVSVFNGNRDYTAPAAEEFQDTEFSVSSRNFTCRLLMTPAEDNWVASQYAGGYAQSFAAGNPLSAVLISNIGFYLDPPKDMNVLFVIRDQFGNALPEMMGEAVVNWKDLWYPDNYKECELDIPAVPSTPGSYTLDIYFNGAHAASAAFSIY